MTRWWRPLRSSAPTLQQTHRTNFGIGTRSPAGARPTEGPIVHRRVRHIQSTAVQAHQPPLPVPGSLGTHVLWAACMGKYKTDEIQLATAVVTALRKGMLCLADRFFPGYQLWQKAAQTGADLLWRVRQNARLEVDQRLADGSYLSRIYSSTSHRRKQRQPIVVRVIEYRLPG